MVIKINEQQHQLLRAALSALEFETSKEIRSYERMLSTAGKLDDPDGIAKAQDNIHKQGQVLADIGEVGRLLVMAELQGDQSEAARDRFIGHWCERCEDFVPDYELYDTRDPNAMTGTVHQMCGGDVVAQYTEREAA